MERFLKVTAGPDLGLEIELLDWMNITMGRSSKCDIQLDDRFCSGRHLRVLASDHETIAVDLQSKNGILVNWVKVEQSKIEDRDIVKLGNTQMQLFENRDIEAMRFANEIADNYEDQWKEGSIDTINERVGQCESRFRTKTIDALVDVDVELRIKSGKPAAAELYHFLGDPVVKRVERLLRFNEL